MGYIRNMLDRVEKEQKRKRYEEGFAWVMVEYYLNKKPCQYLHVHTCYADNSFDRGAQDALTILLRNKECEIL